MQGIIDFIVNMIIALIGLFRWLAIILVVLLAFLLVFNAMGFFKELDRLVINKYLKFIIQPKFYYILMGLLFILVLWKVN